MVLPKSPYSFCVLIDIFLQVSSELSVKMKFQFIENFNSLTLWKIKKGNADFSKISLYFLIRACCCLHLFALTNFLFISLHQKSYETKQYKGLKASDTILKKFPEHGGTIRSTISWILVIFHKCNCIVWICFRLQSLYAFGYNLYTLRSLPYVTKGQSSVF